MFFSAIQRSIARWLIAKRKSRRWRRKRANRVAKTGFLACSTESRLENRIPAGRIEREDHVGKADVEREIESWVAGECGA